MDDRNISLRRVDHVGVLEDGHRPPVKLPSEHVHDAAAAADAGQVTVTLDELAIGFLAIGKAQRFGHVRGCELAGRSCHDMMLRRRGGGGSNSRPAQRARSHFPGPDSRPSGRGYGTDPIQY